MLRLNKADVYAAARQAYLEGRLAAQSKSPICAYRTPSGSPCAIGASIPDGHAIIQNQNDQKVWDLPIRTDNLEALQKLQEAHDNWARARRRGDPLAPRYEDEFKELIGAN